MALWVLFSLLAALTFAVVNIVDKYALTKWVRRPIVPIMILGIIGLVASLLIFLFRGFSQLSTVNIILAFAGGVCYILALLFYFQAAKLQEISRIIPLCKLGSLFVFIMAAVFLGEIFTPVKYLGIAMLIIGAILISKKEYLKFDFGKAFWFMVLSAFAFALNLIVKKYLLDFTDYWTVFGYTRIGTIFVLVPVFYFHFYKLRDLYEEYGVKAVSVISLNESLNVFGLLFITIAASTGFITLVEGLTSLQPLFVLIIATLLSLFYPGILKEEIGKSTILVKLIAVVLTVSGAYLVT